jgi:hypothetical protein
MSMDNGLWVASYRFPSPAPGKTSLPSTASARPRWSPPPTSRSATDRTPSISCRARLGPGRPRARAVTESTRPRRWAVPRTTIYIGSARKGRASGYRIGRHLRWKRSDVTPGWRSTRTIGSESWGFPGGRSRIPNKKAGLTRHFELARGLEPLTCCLQDSCATGCATPA